MQNFTTLKDAQVINVNGLVKAEAAEVTLQNGDSLASGTVLMITQGAEITLAFEDGTQQVISNSDDQTLVIENQTAEQFFAQSNQPSSDQTASEQTDISAIQAVIESGDDDIELPDTASGNLTGNEGTDFVTLDRDGNQVLAGAGYDTAELDTTTIPVENPELLARINQPSVALEDANTIEEDTVATGNVLSNDSDLDDELSVQSFTVAGDSTTYTAGQTAAVENGSLVLNQDGSYNFTPAENYNGEVPVVTYTTNTNASETLAILVTPVSDLVDENEVDSIDEDTTISGNVLTNADSADGDTEISDFTVNETTFAVGETAELTEGSLTINQDGSYTFVPVDNFNGVVPEATYTVSDGINTEISTLNIDVIPVSDLTDDNEEESIDEDTSLSGNVLTNGASTDGTPVVSDFSINETTFTVGQTAELTEGNLTVNQDGSYTFVPAENFNGNVPLVTYTVSDGINTDISTLTIDVAPVSDLIDDDEVVVTDEDTSITGNVLTNASSADGTPQVSDFNVNNTTFTVGQTAQLTEGSLTVNQDGGFSFVPAPNFNGDVPVVTYTVSDGVNTDTSTLTIGVTPVSDLIDGNESVSTPENVAVSGSVLNNAASTDGIPVVSSFTVNNTTFSVGQTAQLPQGTLSINQNGGYSFVPANNFDGNVPVVTYTVSDGINTDTSTLSIVVIPPPPPQPPADNQPLAANDSFSTREATEISGNVLNNDNLGDGPTTVTAFDSASINGGAVNVNPDGTFSYTPAANFVGADTFTYTITDDDGDTSTATVTINVTNDNQLPNAVADSFNVDENTPLTGSLLGNDDLGDGPTIVSAFDSASTNGGIVNVNPDGTFSYSPAANFVGADTFTYTITDDDGDTSTATVTVNVANVNQLPEAVNDSFSVGENTPLNGSLLGNDDLGDGPTTVTAFDSASTNGGTVNVNSDGTFSYTPAADFVGADTFTYTITDNDGDTSTATVTVNVSNVNLLPDAVDDSFNMDENTQLNGSLLGNDDLGDGPTTVTAFDSASTNGGTVNVNSNGTFSYTPAADFVGADTFTYTITDNDGDTSTATVTVNVANVNQLPEAVNDSFNVDENTPLTGGLLGNDDLGDGPTSVTAFDSASTNGGMVNVNPDGTFSYTPAPDFVGADTFTYTITDNDGDTSTATVTVNVANVNLLPEAVNDSFNMDENTQLNGSLLGNDDLGDGPTSVTAFDSASTNGGTVNVNPDGTFSYKPTANFVGADTFTYTITDSDGDTSTATVTVNVANVNAPPEAVDDSYNVNEGQIVSGNIITSNDSDGGDGGTLFLTQINNNDVVFDPTTGNATFTVIDGKWTAVSPSDISDSAFTGVNDNGILSINAQGVFTYENKGFTQGQGNNPTFQYTLSDGIDTDTANVSITVASSGPDANNDATGFAFTENDARTVQGNVTGLGRGSSGDARDNFGTDGAGSPAVTQVALGVNSPVLVNATGDSLIDTQFGTLHINEKGAYRFVEKPGLTLSDFAGTDFGPGIEKNANGDIVITFTYTIQDGDGLNADTDSANLTVLIDLPAEAPVASGKNMDVDPISGTIDTDFDQKSLVHADEDAFVYEPDSSDDLSDILVDSNAQGLEDFLVMLGEDSKDNSELTASAKSIQVEDTVSMEKGQYQSEQSFSATVTNGLLAGGATVISEAVSPNNAPVAELDSPELL